MITSFIAGFSINFFTSADDALTNIPVLSISARTHKGRFAFALGNLTAVTLAVALAYGLSRVLTSLPYSNIIVSTLVFIMAFVIYFNLLSIKPPQKLSQNVSKQTISSVHFTKLVILGFFMTFTTMLDDMFALAPLFVDDTQSALAAIAGIYTAAIILIVSTIYFADKLTALPHKRLIATLILVIFGFLLLFNIA